MRVGNVPTRAGPVPDQMTIWPMDDGRYGLDHSFRQELGGAWTLRFGPLSAAEISAALMAFVQ